MHVKIVNDIYGNLTQPARECPGVALSLDAKLQMAIFYFTGPILTRHDTWTVIFNFDLIKPRLRVRLGLGLRVRVYC